MGKTFTIDADVPFNAKRQFTHIILVHLCRRRSVSHRVDFSCLNEPYQNAGQPRLQGTFDPIQQEHDEVRNGQLLLAGENGFR
jgi:hypothetical protein